MCTKVTSEGKKSAFHPIGTVLVGLVKEASLPFFSHESLV